MESLGEDSVVIFQDEVIIHFSPSITRMRSLKGHQPEILTYDGRQRQHLIGAVELFVGKVHVSLSDTLKVSHSQ